MTDWASTADAFSEKAVQNGLLSPGEKPDDKELLYLILQPGFSTAAVVTAISGRGVGMDVVHKNISRLRGKIDIHRFPGQGTTFTIRLPLTLAMIDGLIIRVGAQRYILPTNSVRESFHPKSCQITSLPGGGELVQMRKEVIPLLRLREHFQVKEDMGLQRARNSGGDRVGREKTVPDGRRTRGQTGGRHQKSGRSL